MCGAKIIILFACSKFFGGKMKSKNTYIVIPNNQTTLFWPKFLEMCITKALKILGNVYIRSIKKSWKCAITDKTDTK